MQYKPEAEKVAMVGGTYTPGGQVVSLTDDPQVQRTRKIFLILVGICLALCLLGLVSAFFGSNSKTGSIDASQGYKIAQALLSTLFYGFGFIVAYKYSTIGLRVFGWIGIVLLVITGIGILAMLAIAIIALTASSGLEEDGKSVAIAAAVMAFIAIAVYLLVFIFAVVIVKFAFKLARLIDANKRLVVQHM